jgi:hypothetical protein
LIYQGFQPFSSQLFDDSTSLPHEVDQRSVASWIFCELQHQFIFEFFKPNRGERVSKCSGGHLQRRLQTDVSEFLSAVVGSGCCISIGIVAVVAVVVHIEQ